MKTTPPTKVLHWLQADTKYLKTHFKATKDDNTIGEWNPGSHQPLQPCQAFLNHSNKNNILPEDFTQLRRQLLS